MLHRHLSLWQLKIYQLLKLCVPSQVLEGLIDNLLNLLFLWTVATA
jgi:hypothetical protein